MANNHLVNPSTGLSASVNFASNEVASGHPYGGSNVHTPGVQLMYGPAGGPLSLVTGITAGSARALHTYLVDGTGTTMTDDTNHALKVNIVTGSATVSGAVSMTGATLKGAVVGTTAAADASVVGVDANTNALHVAIRGPVSKYSVVSAASTNAANIKSTPGRLLGGMLWNVNAAVRYVKFHDTAGTPTAGSGVYLRYAVPGNTAGAGTPLGIPTGGVPFTAGIGITIVTGAADTDATAVAANDVMLSLYFN